MSLRIVTMLGMKRLLWRTSLKATRFRLMSSQHRVILLPEIPSCSAENNKLLQHFSVGLPDLSPDAVTERHCYFGLGKALLEFESAVCQMEEACEAGEADFDLIFVDMEKAKCHLESVWNSVNVMHVATDMLDRDRYVQLNRRAERALLTRLGSKSIHNALKRIKAKNEENPVLRRDQIRMLERYLMEYKHQGFDLPDKKFQELTTNWMKRLGEAVRDYNFKHTVRTS